MIHEKCCSKTDISPILTIMDVPKEGFEGCLKKCPRRDSNIIPMRTLEGVLREGHATD